MDLRFNAPLRVQVHTTDAENPRASPLKETDSTARWSFWIVRDISVFELGLLIEFQMLTTLNPREKKSSKSETLRVANILIKDTRAVNESKYTILMISYFFSKD